MNAVQKAFYSGEDYENCYIFAPSISKRKTVDRQTYYVRRYFRGGKDFEKTMKNIRDIKRRKCPLPRTVCL